MKYSFHPEAESEFGQAIEYYEEREGSLGHDFAVEVYSAIERAVKHGRSLKMMYGVLWFEDFRMESCMRKKTK